MFKGRGQKTITVSITAPESKLEFEIDKHALGKQLFDQVVKTLGLREIWFFGIQYKDKDGNQTWLRLDKKISSHDLPHSSSYDFHFLVKFYPENVTEELILLNTIRCFYVQVKQGISSGNIYCSCETAVLLSSYVCQVKFGPYDAQTFTPSCLPIKTLIPGKDQYTLSDEDWGNRIISCYKEHGTMTTEDAMLQYLQLAQDLEMYGVEMFPIKNRKGTELVLGVDALGLSIYEKGNLLTPKIGFPWSEVRNLSYKDKRFIIKPTDQTSKEFYFLTEKPKINKRILALCTGNHELYMRRRKDDSIELQQMKIQAKEDKEARERERRQLTEEKMQRLEIQHELEEMKLAMRKRETECEAAQSQVNEFQERVQDLNERLTEEREANRELEESQKRLAQTNEDLKQENRASNEEQTRLMTERAKIEAEIATQRSAVEKREREKLAAEQELDRMRRNGGGGDNGSHDDGDSSSEELEVIENLQRPEEQRCSAISRDEVLQQKVTALQSELAAARNDKKMTATDRIHEENSRKGVDKYKTLRQIRSGNTKKRVELFESLVQEM